VTVDTAALRAKIRPSYGTDTDVFVSIADLSALCDAYDATHTEDRTELAYLDPTGEDVRAEAALTSVRGHPAASLADVIAIEQARATLRLARATERLADAAEAETETRIAEATPGVVVLVNATGVGMVAVPFRDRGQATGWIDVHDLADQVTAVVNVESPSAVSW
jgi:hypothetical protein